MSLVVGRCAICGTPGQVCVPAPGVDPVDLPKGRSPVSGELKEYDVTVRGTKTTLQLSEEDARDFGVLDGATAGAERKPGPDDASAMEDQSARAAFGGEAKAKAPQNKARTAAPIKE